MLSKQRIIKELIPLIIVVSISFIVLPVSGVNVGNNTAKILHEAHQVSHGKTLNMTFEDQQATRGPLLPLILALSFKLGGKDVQAASLAARSFFTLIIILAYLLGRILFSAGVGFLFSSLVLTSYGINEAAVAINTDIIHPFFNLLFVLLFYLAKKKSSCTWAVLSGFILGLALMVKESAIFCLGVPLAMAVFAPPQKKKEGIKLAFWVIIAVTLTLSPWAFYIFKNHGSLLPMLGVAHPQYQMATAKQIGYHSPFAYWVSLFSTGLLKAIFNFYQNVLQKVTPLSPLLIVSCLFAFIRAVFFRKLSDLLLVISLICFLPLILRVGDLGLRLGQTVMIYMLLYLFLAIFIISSINFLVEYVPKVLRGSNFFLFKKILKPIRSPLASKKRDAKLSSLNKKKLTVSLLITLVGFFLIMNQLIGKNRTWEMWKSGEHALAIFSKKSFEVRGRYTTRQQKAAEWLKMNATKQAKLAADGFTQEALDFFDASNNEVSVFHTAKEIVVPIDIIKKRDDNSRLLFLITYHSFCNGPERLRAMFLIFEDDILNFLRKDKPDYLIISGRGLFMRIYLDRAYWAHLRFDNKDLRIYEINHEKIGPVIFEHIGVNETINEHLAWLSKNHPEEYLLFKEKIAILGLNVEMLVNSPYKLQSGEVY
ncbi:MAG: glycosyltransferase family 39 protein [Candidatus Aminicenantes bacterium]|nr:glycosyltransferase family 39 protein [Candidatus Aminicenantes bacterium]